jgi:hypothetical protein
MTWLDRLLSLFGIERITITLKAEERGDGYIFISSPELKGFSLLLGPGDYSDFKAFIDAVYEPLTTYMDAYMHALGTARRAQVRPENLRLRGTKMSGDVAKLCFQ